MKKPPHLPMIIAAALLAVAVAVLYGSKKVRQNLVSSDGIPLARSLTQIPERFGPYEKVGEESLPENIVKQLGTTDYIIWYYRDTRLPPGAAGNGIRLHIGYWSGTRQILSTGVHYPELCYTGGGAKTMEMRTCQIFLGNPDDSGAAPLSIPLRIFQFYGENAPPRTVGYYFLLNGRRIASANYLRLATFLGPTRNLYYSKVEVMPGTLGTDQDGATRLALGVSEQGEALRVIQEFLTQAQPGIEAMFPGGGR